MTAQTAEARRGLLSRGPLLGLWWADPVAGLAIVMFLLHEGWEAWNGEDDDDD